MDQLRNGRPVRKHRLGFPCCRKAYSVLVFFVTCVLGGTVTQRSPEGQDVFSEHFPRLDWQPTRAPEAAEYAGKVSCGQCHAKEAATYHSTPMARALELASESRILKSHLSLKFQSGPYTFKVQRLGQELVYEVSDNQATISEPVQWVFGSGEAGQTFLIQHQGAYYESRVSLFSDIEKLDFTLGHPRTVPDSLLDALGQELSPDKVLACFACHSTASVSGTKLQLDRLVPGITCEGCHGPGGRHVRAALAGKVEEIPMFNPGKLSEEDQLDYCGSCHRSYLQVELMGLRGVNNVRFQPYRLANSTCFKTEHSRISCSACHNPHEARQRHSAFYDSRCIACHSKGQVDPAGPSKVSICPTGKAQCTVCHMPKYKLPGGHFEFTDHQIRIVRSNSDYPN